MFVTSTKWARIAAEVRQNHAADLEAPWNLPHKGNFKRLKLGKLTVITANWFEVPPDFRARVESLKTGRGGRIFYPDKLPE